MENRKEKSKALPWKMETPSQKSAKELFIFSHFFDRHFSNALKNSMIFFAAMSNHPKKIVNIF